MGRQSVVQVNHLCPHFKTPMEGSVFHMLVGDGGYLWQKVLYHSLTLVYMTVYNVMKLV